MPTQKIHSNRDGPVRPFPALTLPISLSGSVSRLARTVQRVNAINRIMIFHERFFFCDGDAAVTRISSSRTNWSFYQKWNDVLWDTIGALQFFCVNLIFFVCVPFASSYSYVKWRTYSLWQICAHIALPSCLLVLFCHISFFCWPPSTNKFGVCVPLTATSPKSRAHLTYATL